MFDELKEITGDKLKLAAQRQRIARYIRADWQMYLRIYAVEEIDADHEERLARVLARVVNLMPRVIREPKQKIDIVFGRFPYFAVDAGTGAELYVANTRKEKALANADNRRIYVDAFRIFPDKGNDSVAWTVILEEIVHSWMLLHDENITSVIVGRLTGPGYLRAAEDDTNEVIEAYEPETPS